MYPLESLLRFRLNSGWIVVQWNSTETGTAWTKIETNICYTLSSWQLDTFLDGTVITSTSIQALNINIISSDLLNWTLQRCLRHVTWLIYTAPANVFFFRRFLLTRLTDFIGKKLKRFLLFVLMLSSIQNYIPFNDNNENNSNNRPGKVDTIKSPCIYVTTFFSTSPVHDEHAWNLRSYCPVVWLFC